VEYHDLLGRPDPDMQVSIDAYLGRYKLCHVKSFEFWHVPFARPRVHKSIVYGSALLFSGTTETSVSSTSLTHEPE